MPDGSGLFYSLSHRRGVASPEDAARSGGALWRSRHAVGDDARTAPADLSRCPCPGEPGAVQCRQVGDGGGDFLCAACRNHCWAITAKGEGMRLVRLYGTAHGRES